MLTSPLDADQIACLAAAATCVAQSRIEAAEAQLLALGPPTATPLREPAWLEALAADLTAAQEWQAAHGIYAMLLAAGHRRYRGREAWLARRAQDQPAFRAHYVARPALGRLADHLAARLGAAVTAIETVPMRPGLVAMALFRHRVAVAGREAPLTLVEKVFSDRPGDIAKVENGELLFSSVAAEALLAPAYYGRLPAGRFASNFHAFHDAAPLPLADWALVQAELLYRHWCLIPPDRLLRDAPRLAPAFLSFLHQAAAGELAPDLAAALSLPAATVAARIAGHIPRIAALIGAMPVFVFHDDLHVGNMLFSERDGLAVIDWDNWVLAPLGTGWHVPGTADPAPIDPARIRWARPLPPDLGAPEMMLMARLWAVVKAQREKKPDLAARRLERLLDAL